MKKLVFTTCYIFLLLQPNFLFAQDNKSSTSTKTVIQDIGWSQDNRYVYFSAMTVNKDYSNYKPDLWTIYRYDIEKDCLISIARSSLYVSISNNGELAFSVNVGKNRKIYVSDSLGNNRVLIADIGTKSFAPSWSPNGDKIAFNSNASGNVEIYIWNRKDKSISRLTHSDTSHAYNPAWSSDGKYIAYYLEKGDHKDQIYIIRPDGNDNKNLTQDTFNNIYPRWKKNNTVIYGRTGQTPSANLYQITIDGKDKQPVNNINSFYGNFSPDGEKLAYVDKSQGKIIIQTKDGAKLNEIILSKTNITQSSVFPSLKKDSKIPINVAIFIFDGMEILDFAGPAEVFEAASIKIEDKWYKPFKVYTIAASKENITSQGFVELTPNFSIFDCPKPDIIIIPGGSTLKSRKDKEIIEWLKNNSSKDQTLLSICTGAFFLADAGLLDGKKATTWYGKIENLKSSYPKIDVLEKVRFVDNDNIITTAGVSAGIDGSLHLVAKILSFEVAKRVAKYMEYDKWVPKDGFIVDVQKLK